MELVDNNGNPLSPAVTDVVTFTVNGQQSVNDIASLRAGLGSNDTFTLTGEAIVSYTQGFRDQIFIQDNTAGILIDDPNDVITLSLNIGDGLTGLQGTVGEFDGQLQFTPVADVNATSSTGNALPAEVVTISQLVGNEEDYESELIKLENVSFDPAVADGTNTFATGTEYVLSDGTNTFTLRTSFFSADYIGNTIPSAALDVTGIITEREDANNNRIYVITPRSDADIETLSFGEVSKTVFTLSPNPSAGSVVVRSESNGPMTIEFYNSLGQLAKTVQSENRTADASGLGTGVYFVRITQGIQTSVQKLIVR
jgi:hypothetical protein